MGKWTECSKKTKDGKCGHPLPERVGVYSQEEVDIVLTHYEEGRLIDVHDIALAWNVSFSIGSVGDAVKGVFPDLAEAIEAAIAEEISDD